MTPEAAHRRMLVSCLAAVYLIWGTSYLATRIGVLHMPPLLFAGSRFLISGALLTAVAFWRGFRPAQLAGQWQHLLVMSAMWLWTLGGGTNGGSSTSDEDESEEEDEETPRSSKNGAGKSGFVLEFDASRKIAQGLGIHLEKSESIVEVKGDKARLLPVGERTRYLFGKEEALAATARGAAGEIWNVSQVFHPSGRWLASNS